MESGCGFWRLSPAPPMIPRVMTPTEAEGYVNRGWQHWKPVLEALECLEQQVLDTE